MKVAATICLVETIAQGRGPWIFWHDLEASCAAAARLGFDGVELFSAAAEQTPAGKLSDCLERHGLELAALGTGAGKLLHGLDLASADADVRSRARDYVAAFVDLGGEMGAPVIVGSMQGTLASGGSRERLAEELAALSERAASAGALLLLEPVNRYEGDFFRGPAEADAFLDEHGLDRVQILADLFHMSIEEASIPEALRAHGGRIGHVHFADSNRKAPGLGHTDFTAIADALRDRGYDGYLSAEALPEPDPETAAAQVVRAFREAGFA